MKKNILLRTNCLVCVVIILGFLLTAVFSYNANYTKSMDDIEKRSSLTSESIFYQMSNIFTKPVNISLTMANDSLLHSFLSQETTRLDDPSFADSLKNYLETYQQTYQYDAVFLVSTATDRYYNYNGMDRVLSPDNDEDTWYFDGIQNSDADCSINVDNDQVHGADNAITIFVNCRIKNDDGSLMGVVGVGVRIDSIQKLLQSYRDEIGVNAYLIDDEGTIELSTEYSGYEKVNLFELQGQGEQERSNILGWKEDDAALHFWSLNGMGQRKDFIVARYLPELQWHLVVERDTSVLMDNLNRQLSLTILMLAAILSVVLYVITKVIRRFNGQIVELTQDAARERQDFFEKATEQLFENIYELDITNNRPANAATEEYFESLGAPPGSSYETSMALIAEKQIKAEFRRGYFDTFLPKNVMRAYEEGKESLSYEFMITRDGMQYYWMRITARIVKWESDGTIHLFVYRQNIDAEKRREQKMLELAYTDEMTGLLTKMAAQRHMNEELAKNKAGGYVYFIFDIDNFKQSNDQFGHAFGDSVICDFVRIIRENFRRGDILGRLGGDEFSAFIPVDDRAWAEHKAAELCRALNRTHTWSGMNWHMSSSIGAAFFPEDGADAETLYRHADAALYRVKREGKNGFAFYDAAKDDMTQE